MSYLKQYKLKDIGKEFKDIKDKLPTVYGGNSDSNIINTLLQTTTFENIYFNENSNIDDSYNIKIKINDTYSSNIYNLNLSSNNNDDNIYNFTIDNYDTNINYYFNYIKIQNNIIDTNIDITNITINNYSNNNFDQTIENNYYYNNSDFNDIRIDNSNIIINIDTSDQNLDYRIDLNLIKESKSDTYLNKNLIFQNKINYLDNLNNLNKIIFKNDGSIGIGTDITHNYSLYVNNISNTKKGIYCADDITILSDINFKKDIKTIENPIDKLINLRGVTYKRIDRDDDNIRYGFIAQEVQKILPEACDGEKGIKQIDIVALVVETIKELIKKNNLKI
jgi:hypothetical protein